MLELFDLSDLIGKPFKYGGRGPSEYDCYGLAIEIYSRKGHELPDINSPTEFETIHSAGQELKSLISVEIEKPEPFCIVGFKIRPPYISHMGIVLDDTFHFIHILRNTNVCVERLNSIIWKDKIGGFYRVI